MCSEEFCGWSESAFRESCCAQLDCVGLAGVIPPRQPNIDILPSAAWLPDRPTSDVSDHVPAIASSHKKLSGDYRTLRKRRERRCRDMVESPSQGPIDTPGPELRDILPILLHCMTGILHTAVRMMKYPISITLAILACAYPLAIMSDPVTSLITPMCSLPIVALLCPAIPPTAPPRPSNPERTPLWADFPNLVNVGSKTLECLLDETVEGPGLALEIKKAEMATSALATRVRASNLDNREILADSLSEFAKDAGKVSRGLTRFSSRVGGAVDKYVDLRSGLT